MTTPTPEISRQDIEALYDRYAGCGIHYRDRSIYVSHLCSLALKALDMREKVKALQDECKAWREHAAEPVGGIREKEVVAARTRTDTLKALED